nr:MAG TPA: hypothetical protein [Caudoviricetes sp.]
MSIAETLSRLSLNYRIITKLYAKITLIYLQPTQGFKMLS